MKMKAAVLTVCGAPRPFAKSKPIQIAELDLDPPGEGGSIINISSAGALRPRPQIAPYAGAKAALNAITEAFAFEYGPKVRVNTISPGRFLTDVSKAWSDEHKLNSTAALKRSGSPEEIVTAALYLASSKSSFTTGSVVRVDGGIA